MSAPAVAARRRRLGAASRRPRHRSLRGRSCQPRLFYVGGAQRLRPRRRPRKCVSNAYEVRYGCRDRSPRDNSSPRPPRLLRCPKLMIFFPPCCTQAGDPIERAVRFQTGIDGLAKVSKSSWRCACPPRAVATARLLLPVGSRPARPARARACRARCAPAARLSTVGVSHGWTCRAIFWLRTLSKGPSEIPSLIYPPQRVIRRCDRNTHLNHIGVTGTVSTHH